MYPFGAMIEARHLPVGCDTGKLNKVAEGIGNSLAAARN